jgi:hypothetical protein
VVSMLASGTRVRGSDFFGQKNPQHAFLRKGSKAVCPMSQICGMLKNPVITWKLGHRQNLPAISRPIVHLLLLGALALLGTWRHLAERVRTSKGRGKQWQTTPMNLPRMQHTTAIPVA